MPSRGVAYVAYGPAAIAEARASIDSLRQFHDWPVCVVTGAPEQFPDCTTVGFDAPGPGARRAKLALYSLLPRDWQSFLYLDADTRVRGNIGAGFDVIADGWELAITASTHQDIGWMWHGGEAERHATLDECGRALQLQGGVWFAARTPNVRAFMGCWLEQWERWTAVDQGALMRALERVPVRVWMLGRDWNGGALVEHLFGRARA